jgi:hypothetical protein
MKIRIKGNSIRYRLSKPEVAKFCSEGYIRETVTMPGGEFTYAVQSSDDLELSAFYRDHTITLLVPQTLTQNWELDNRVGFNATVPLSGGDSFQLFLEKDFKCLDGREEETDNYENPLNQAS